MSLTKQFLTDVQIFVTDIGITESVLGSRSVGDSQVIARLQNGKSITLRTADRLYDYMATERARRAEAAEIVRAAGAEALAADTVPDALAAVAAADLDIPRAPSERGLWAWLKGALAGWLA